MPTLAAMLLHDAVSKGGPGSGNFGHDGRPGEVGGSAGEGGGGGKDKPGSTSRVRGEAKPSAKGDEIHFSGPGNTTYVARIKGGELTDAKIEAARNAVEREHGVRLSEDPNAFPSFSHYHNGEETGGGGERGSGRTTFEVKGRDVKPYPKGEEIHFQGKGNTTYVARISGKFTDAKAERAVRQVERDHGVTLPRDSRHDFPSFTWYRNGEEIGGG